MTALLPPVDAERPVAGDAGARAHRELTRRAGAAALGGGLVLVAVAASFGPGLFLADARALGIGLGVLVVALSVAPLTGARVGSAVGPLLVAAGVLSLPVAAGGLGLGSVLVVGAGVVLGALEPPPADAVVTDAPAGPGRRAGALALDTGLAALVVVAVAVAPTGDALAASTAAVVLAWVFAWGAVTLPVALVAGASPGAWLLGVRLLGARDVAASPDGVPPSRAGWRGVLARQALRGAVAVIGLLLVLTALLALGAVPAAAVGAVVVALAAVAATGAGTGRRPWFDLLTGTVPVVRRVRPA